MGLLTAGCAAEGFISIASAGNVGSGAVVDAGVEDWDLSAKAADHEVEGDVGVDGLSFSVSFASCRGVTTVGVVGLSSSTVSAEVALEVSSSGLPAGDVGLGETSFDLDPEDDRVRGLGTGFARVAC